MTLENNIDIQPKLVLIAGGSGSGKTFFVCKLLAALTDERALLISQDNYYKNLDHLSYEERCRINFDHPDSIDFKLLAEHLNDLKQGKSVDIPEYDFSTHSRKKSSIRVSPKPVILLEGILILSQMPLLSQADMKIYIDAADDIRILRRLRRDVKERGRSVESIIDQYIETVRPMHKLYVEPSKQNADVIISGEKPADESIRTIVNRLI